jgi:hypothetical protein
MMGTITPWAEKGVQKATTERAVASRQKSNFCITQNSLISAFPDNTESLTI